MSFPKHLTMHIEHNPHKDYYMTVAQYLDDNEYMKKDIDPIEAKICCETNELWTIQWYPRTPISFWWVGASTLERALELAREIADKEKL